MSEESSTPASTSSSGVMKNIVSGILNSLTLTAQGVNKTDSFDPTSVPVGNGEVTCEITRFEQINPGLPDFFIHLSILGMTFASVDTAKTVIRTAFADVMRSVLAFTPSSLTTATGVTVDGILQISNAAIREDADRFMFVVDFKLAVGNLAF